jgi:hypothetical protein
MVAISYICVLYVCMSTFVHQLPSYILICFITYSHQMLSYSLHNLRLETAVLYVS